MLYCHRTMLKKVRFTPSLQTHRTFQKAAYFMQRCFSSSQADLVHEKGSSLPILSPQSRSSPLMFVPPINVDVDGSADYNDYFNFFSPGEQTKIRVTKKFTIPWQKEILTPDDAICVGSSNGWLTFVHPRSCRPYLFNPLLQESSHLPYVPLPPYETLNDIKCLRAQKADLLSPSTSLVKDFMLINRRNWGEDAATSDYTSFVNRSVQKESIHFIQKVAMSSAPSLPRSSSTQKCDEDCTVLIIHGEDLYFCKLGDHRWHPCGTLLPESWINEGMTLGYYEIMYFSKDQRFYAMTGPDHIDVLNLSDPSRQELETISPSSPTDKFGFYYLVESSGDLLLVMRCYDIGTSRFEVYKLNFDQIKWEPVECLDDRALFVGPNHSFSLSTADYPDIRENSIYFTNHEDNYTRLNYGIFHLKDDSSTPYHPFTLKSGELPGVAAFDPIWVAPNKL